MNRGIAVRVLVRKLDNRADALRSLGAEVTQGDLLEPDSVTAALEGVDKAFFGYPVAEGRLEAAAIFAGAARESQTHLIVNLSQLQNATAPGSRRNLRRKLADPIFAWAGVNTVNLQATMFYGSIQRFVTQIVATMDTVYLPLGDGTAHIPLISSDDVAHVASALLANPTIPAGSYSLVGDLPAITEMIETFSDLVGRKIEYVDVPDDQYRKMMEPDVDPYVLEHFTDVFKFYRTSNMED